MKKALFLLGIISCSRAVPASSVAEEPPVDSSVDQCVSLTTCNGVGELLPLLVPLLPVGPQGVPGLAGKDGVSVTLDEVVVALLPLVPEGAVGPQGVPGVPGQSASVTDVVAVVLPLLPPGPQGVPGVPGLQGSQGDVGATGATGSTGAQGPAGVGLSNVSTLSAVKVYSPSVLSFNGTISVNSPAVFVPRSLKVVEGSQSTGFASLTFGTSVCSYQGNNKSIDANAAYNLVDCRDDQNVVLGDMVPGKPFAFTGTITLSIGAGADTAAATQAVAFLQVQ